VKGTNPIVAVGDTAIRRRDGGGGGAAVAVVI